MVGCPVERCVLFSGAYGMRPYGEKTGPRHVGADSISARALLPVILDQLIQPGLVQYGDAKRLRLCQLGTCGLTGHNIARLFADRASRLAAVLGDECLGLLTESVGRRAR